jgi:hypothetical protein
MPTLQKEQVIQARQLNFLNLKSMVLDILDIEGQENYRTPTKFFFKDALMAIMVYDIERGEFYDKKMVKKCCILHFGIN